MAVRLEARPVGEAQRAIAPARLALLGGFELTIGEQDVRLPFNAQRLLAFLAMQEHPLQRPFVAGSLWPDSPDLRSSANLRSTLWRVHRIDAGLVEANGQQLRLGTKVAVDARESTLLACRVIGGVVVDERTDLDPLFIEGELLPDCYDDWVLAQRERVRQLRLHALETLCEVLTRQGRYGQAVQAGLAAVCGEPLRESAERALISAHLAHGNVAEALRRYRSFRQLLFNELGIEPTSLLEDLVRHLIH